MLPQLLWSGIWVAAEAKGLLREIPIYQDIMVLVYDSCAAMYLLYPFSHIFHLNVCNTMPKQLVHLSFTLKAQFEQTLISGIK